MKLISVGYIIKVFQFLSLVNYFFYIYYNISTMYYVYILLCSDNSLYTGYTTDLKQRVKVHNEGKGSKYVRSRLPAKLIYYEKFKKKEKALKREAEIKLWEREEKIRTLELDDKI